jgi:hypothetical protein
MVVTEEMKKEYLDDIYSEMKRRGFSDAEIPIVIGKTGFMSAFDEYPDVQLHYDPRDAVTEIIETAARF